MGNSVLIGFRHFILDQYCWDIVIKNTSFTVGAEEDRYLIVSEYMNIEYWGEWKLEELMPIVLFDQTEDPNLILLDSWSNELITGFENN